MLQAYRLQQGNDASVVSGHEDSAWRAEVRVPDDRRRPRSVTPAGGFAPALARGRALASRPFCGSFRRSRRGIRPRRQRDGATFTEFDGYRAGGRPGARSVRARQRLLGDRAREGGRVSVPLLPQARPRAAARRRARARQRRLARPAHARHRSCTTCTRRSCARCRDEKRRPTRKDADWLRDVRTSTRLDEAATTRCRRPRRRSSSARRRTSWPMSSCSSRPSASSKTGRTPSVSRCRSAVRWTAMQEPLARAEPVVIDLGNGLTLPNRRTDRPHRRGRPGVVRGARLQDRRLLARQTGRASSPAAVVCSTRSMGWRPSNCSTDVRKKPKIARGVYYFSSHKGRQERESESTARPLAAIACGAGRPARGDRAGAFIHAAGRGRLQVLRLRRRVRRETRTRRLRPSWATRSSTRSGGSRPMSDAAPTRGRAVARDRIREELLDQHPRRGRRRLRQDADAGRAHGRRRGRTVCTRSSTWRPSPSRARPRPSCAAASSWRSRTQLVTARQASEAPTKRDRARLAAALSNLERFFAGTIHSFCARLLRERPVESGVSPGFTELDEVQDLRAAPARRGATSSPARERPATRRGGAARGRHQAEGSRPGVRDGLRQRRCGVPAGGRDVSGSEAGVRRRSTSSGRRLQKHMPSTIDAGHHVRDAAGRAAVRGPVARVAEAARPGPAVLAALLATWDRESEDHEEVVGGRQRREKRIARPIIALHDELSCRRRRALSRGVAAVRLSAVRLRLLTRARDARRATSVGV